VSTHWLYIGCNLSELPPNFLEDSKKLTKDEIKGILETIPIVDGSITAASQDQLIKILISNGIYPIKIKPHSNVDDRIIRLRNIRNKASKSINPDKYIEEVRILNQFPLPEPKKSWKLKLFIIVIIVIAIIAAVTMMKTKYQLPLLEN
jgi:hypothetical protein